MLGYRGVHLVRVGGQAFRLTFDFNALAFFEEVTGKPVLGALAEMEAGSTALVSDLRALCWAGLQRHHPGLTIADAGDLLSAAPGCVRDALTLALPDAAEAGQAGAGKKTWRRAIFWAWRIVPFCLAGLRQISGR